MFIELTIGVVVFVFLWIYNKSIKAYAKGLEDRLKMVVVEDSVERAPQLVALSKTLDELGDIPNLDDLLARANGKLKPTVHQTSHKPEVPSKATATVAK